MKINLIDTVPCENTLGEGIQWNKEDGCFWWTDIHSSKLYRYHLETKKVSTWDLPEKLGCFAFAKDDSRILAAFASGFAWFDVEAGSVEWIAKPENIPGNRSNDGRCDRQGRFWMGTVVDEKKSAEQFASLYCLQKSGEVSKHLSGLRISNSLCWSPDSRKMYHADSPSHILHSYDFDAQTGHISNPQVFAETEEGVEPDGACVDAEGFVWNAQWGASRVVRYAADGTRDFVLSMPVSQATCLAFGGDKLNLLAVTSARIGLDEQALKQQPQAGNVFIFETDVFGLEESRFG